MSNILFVTKSQQNRGTFWRGWYLGTQLSRRGIDFTLICPAEHRQLGVRYTEYSKSFRVITLPRLATKTVPGGMVLRAALVPFLHKLRSRDIVHVCAPAMPETFSAVLLAHLVGTPLVIDIDDWWGIDPDGKRSNIESKVEQFLEEKSVAMSDEVITASSLLSEKVESFNGYKAEVIPNGVDPSDFSALDNDECRTALLSRLGLRSESKIFTIRHDSNFSHLYKPIGEKLSNDGEDSRLLVIGLQESEKFGNNVVCIPSLKRLDWLRVVAGSDALFLPMEETMWERARFPIKLAEFMATGKPVLSSAVGESRRVLDEAGYSKWGGRLYFANRAEEVMMSIDYISEHPEQVEDIVRAAREYTLSNLSWERIATRYLGSIGHLVRK